jgi:hypothetical protein
MSTESFSTAHSFSTLQNFRQRHHALSRNIYPNVALLKLQAVAAP